MNAEMANASNARIHQVSSMSELDENLLSMENLDRASPELWPEKIPGMSNFVNQTAAANTSGQPWNKELDSEDINLLHRRRERQLQMECWPFAPPNITWSLGGLKQLLRAAQLAF
ncbi:protein lin-52 homolog isoform X2 [Schistocerca gregaria]|uniref:protein lin-52 homolog isoform X2 n=1 Tax=Schistocerca gregaria TaxID=7010 RepID=UPI00211EF68E|nr:protein lin-52 homolog isoform X2 [Schistocerca gregaria]